jgi:hypothetical protein
MVTVTTGLDPLLVAWLERTMLRAPRLVDRATWELRFSSGGLELVQREGPVRLDQPSCASYGMAVEFLVTALHERSVTARVLPLLVPTNRVLVRLEAAPSAVPSRIDRELMEALDSELWPALLSLPQPGQGPTAYQRDVLMMAAAAHRTTLVWDVPVTPDAVRDAVATDTDTPADWFRAGESTAHVLLRAHTLGLRASLVTPSLRHAPVRQAIRGWLEPERYPQVLLQLHQRAA